MTTKERTKIHRIERQLLSLQREMTLLKLHDIARKKRIFERTGGVLKGLIKRDLTEWQRKVRSEWDHQ